MTDQLFQERYERLKRFGWLALGGGVLVALFSSIGSIDSPLIRVAMVLGALCIVPALFYVVALTIWHWKSRYKGTHSDLWGVLIVVEVSGWFKLVYLFRHIIPDAQRQGRYSQSDDADGT